MTNYYSKKKNVKFQGIIEICLINFYTNIINIKRMKTLSDDKNIQDQSPLMESNHKHRSIYLTFLTPEDLVSLTSEVIFKNLSVAKFTLKF